MFSPWCAPWISHYPIIRCVSNKQDFMIKLIFTVWEYSAHIKHPIWCINHYTKRLAFYRAFISLRCTIAYLLILKTGVNDWHTPTLPPPGYNSSLVIPLSIIYLYTCSMDPPLQPWFPYGPEQSKTYCIDKEINLLFLMKYSDSNAPTALNA